MWPFTFFHYASDVFSFNVLSTFLLEYKSKIGCCYNWRLGHISFLLSYIDSEFTDSLPSGFHSRLTVCCISSHNVENACIWSYFSPYLVRIWENGDQNNSKCWRFLCSLGEVQIFSQHLVLALNYKWLQNPPTF